MRVIFDDEALDELQRIFAWIAKNNRRAAEDLTRFAFKHRRRNASQTRSTTSRIQISSSMPAGCNVPAMRASRRADVSNRRRVFD
jgi:plasmid stabilization system protein ParE